MISLPGRWTYDDNVQVYDPLNDGHMALTNGGRGRSERGNEATDAFPSHLNNKPLPLGSKLQIQIESYITNINHMISHMGTGNMGSIHMANGHGYCQNTANLS